MFSERRYSKFGSFIVGGLRRLTQSARCEIDVDLPSPCIATSRAVSCFLNYLERSTAFSGTYKAQGL